MKDLSDWEEIPDTTSVLTNAEIVENVSSQNKDDSDIEKEETETHVTLTDPRQMLKKFRLNKDLACFVVFYVTPVIRTHLPSPVKVLITGVDCTNIRFLIAWYFLREDFSKICFRQK